MRKTISTILATIALICSFSFILPVCASKFQKDKLNLSQFTLNDLAEMPVDEYRKLLADFERVYDPYDTYYTNPIMEENKSQNATPYWESGDFEKDEEGSHPIITVQSIIVLATDRGFFYNNTTDAASNIIAGLYISLASILPDQQENEAVYEGHFYHAIDG